LEPGKQYLRDNHQMENNEKAVIDMMKRVVLRLTVHGERLVGSLGHQAARKYIQQRMRELDIQPYKGETLELPYEQSGLHFTNIIGKIPGISNNKASILIGAHYDTCGPYPGADDNASAVSILLAFVNKLRSTTHSHDIIVAFFDAEEPPHYLTKSMGSIVFHKEQREGEIRCAVILDLVGHDVPMEGLEDLLFVLGMESHPALDE
jgi:hypothetical protein